MPRFPNPLGNSLVTSMLAPFRRFPLFLPLSLNFSLPLAFLPLLAVRAGAPESVQLERYQLAPFFLSPP